MYIDVKVTAWRRVELPEEMTKEEAIEILESHNSIDYFFDEDEYFKEKYPNHIFEYQEVEHSEEDMTTKENGNQSTLELHECEYDLENNVILWENYKEGIDKPIISIPEFLQKMDWSLLKTQKHALLYTDESTWDNRQRKSIQGILNLIDTIQDYSVDVMGLSEKEVFNLLEENRS